MLRAREFRSFVYDLAFISANKDFTTGGYFDPEDRQVLFQKTDLQGHEPEPGDYFIFQNERYDVQEVHHYEDNHSYGVLARKVRGQEVTRIVTSFSSLIFEDSASYVKIGLLDRSVISSLVLEQILKEVP